MYDTYMFMRVTYDLIRARNGQLHDEVLTKQSEIERYLVIKFIKLFYIILIVM